MARLTETVLKDAYADNAGLTLDVKYGGQFGYSPNLGYLDADGRIKAEWISNKAYVTRNLIPILIEPPRFFTLMPNPEKWVQTLKSLVETHVRTIEGINAGLTVETAEHPIGGAGEMMEEPTNVIRERTTVTMTFTEKEGMSIGRFLEKWIMYGIAHPETKSALVGTLPNYSADVDMLPDWYTMTMLFINPDITHRRALDAWLVGGMFPKTNGENIGKFDKTTAGDIRELSIEFAGFAQYNLGVTQYAQGILDSINLINANPYLEPAFADEIHPDVEAADKGYREDIQDLADSVG
jgi:hypothetical protein